MCPLLETTLKSLPRNFSIVLAFAGDSTITKFFYIILDWMTNVYFFFKNYILCLIINSKATTQLKT